ncbi:MAG: glycosyltransferase family 2 protein [Terriglobia bacterium]
MCCESLVSAVIPTRNRPQLVKRAVLSVLKQSYANIEAVVVVDGPDPLTTQELAAVADPRLRVITLPRSEGGSGARNAGVQAAKGRWIAFLDDDDEWLPTKIECQLAAALHSRHRIPVVSSRIIARTPLHDYIWPRRLPSAREPICDYLFSRTSLFQGEGLLATPTLFTKRDFLLELPFRCGLKKHQDWDWIIRAASQDGVGFEFVDHPLAVCYMDQSRPGISNSDEWRFSLNWAHEMRSYFTPQAYAAFVLIVVAGQAAAATRREYWGLLADSMRRGECRPLHLLIFAGMRLFPRELRRKLRVRLGGRAR